MNRILSILAGTDVYKVAHRTLYPDNTEIIFSNFTPRAGNLSNLEDSTGVFAHGMRWVINRITKEWGEFFALDSTEAEKVIQEYKDLVEKTIGAEFDVQHMKDLYDHKELPIEFRAVKEGSFIKYKTPVLTLHNTDKRFAWLVNYLETRISSYLWPIITASTTAQYLKQTLEYYANLTGVDKDTVNFQAHDFSYRGNMGTEAAMLNGMGHLNYFDGSDNFPAMIEVGKGASVIATEHSVMSAGGKDTEFDTYKRLIERNPKGILSIVSDTWNIYKVVNNILPELRDEIEARDGALVIRPDSGDPHKVLFGGLRLNKPEATQDDKKFAELGLLKMIEEKFGYTVNDEGFKVLPIGVLWGDGVSPKSLDKIMERLTDEGYASSTLVFGVGSYTYQYVTRDTHGFAMKATYAEIGGVGINISKDPITDSGVKKSAVGLLAIIGGKLVEGTDWETVHGEDNELLLVRDA